MAKIPDGWANIHTSTVPRYNSSADFPTAEKLQEVMRAAQEKLAALRASPDYATDLIFTQEAWDKIREQWLNFVKWDGGKFGNYETLGGLPVHVQPTVFHAMSLWLELKTLGRVPKIVTMGTDNGILLSEAPADAPLYVPASPSD